MFINFFQDILNRDCEELRECVKYDLGYEKSDNIDNRILFSDDARNTYYKLNSGHSKTRNWLILDSLQKDLKENK